MSEGIIVRKCESLEEFHRCVELQREIWKEAELEVEPATIFVVASHSGGQVLGPLTASALWGTRLPWRDYGARAVPALAHDRG